MGKSLLRTGVVLSLAILAGRLTGFLREAVLARSFGASADADAAVLLLTMPDLLVNLLLAGGLTAALIPEFKALDRTRAANLFVQSSLMIGATFLALAALIAVFPGAMLGLLAPGLVPEAYANGVAAVRIMAWAIPLSALAGVSGAYLQANERFLAAGLGTLIFNACVIAALLVPSAPVGLITALALGINAGAFLRWAVQVSVLPRARPQGWRTSWLISRPLLLRYVQALLSSSILLAVPVLARAYASTSGEGGIAIFNYASKLVDLPLAVFISLIASVTFPRLSQHFGESIDSEPGRQLLAQAMRLTILLSITVALVCAWYAEPLAAMIFGQGSLSDPDLARLARLAAIGFISLPMQGACYMLTAALNAQRRSHVPLWINLACVSVMSVAMVYFAGELALSSVMVILVLTYTAMMLGLWAAVRARIWGRAGIVDMRVLAGLMGSAILFAGMVALGNRLALGVWTQFAWIALTGGLVLGTNLAVGIPGIKSIIRR
ncbi:murein biosynthesis integral membrane protein MurJ [Bordetella genomosp. 1]|uniref:Lipid II flippase MurJ n=1 Tax=Bordetella genomosp. 1 TaxID=1395607 RepID=A0ABX4F605_9BORD|nr:lipid II flippase MurJ [Bordetella genomosp. 1]OZI68271.1 hypothetical protein CAL27_02015 [Bordetella genomosp. 1]